MEESVRKNRIRLRRGKLSSFEKLPLHAQQSFKTIAIEMKNIDPEINDVFVYGSFFWGNWDDESDYDVRINQKFNYSLFEFKNMMLKDFDINVDVMVHRAPKKEMNLITIPI